MVRLISSLGSDVNKEGSDLIGDGDGAQEELGWGVATTGGGICRVLGTWDVLCVNRSIAILQKLEDATEDLVCWLIGAASLPPAFDDSPVVTMDDEVFSIA